MSLFRLHTVMTGAIGGAFWLLAAWPLSAAELSFAEAQQLALAQSSQLVAKTAVMAATREQAIAAGERPDPILSLGLDNVPANTADRFSLTRDFMTMRRIGLMQEMTRADKLLLRRQRQEQQGLLVGAEKAMTESEVLREAGRAWLESYYLQQILALFDEQLRQAHQQVMAAEANYRGGRSTQAEVLAARADMLLLEDELADLKRQRRVAQLNLVRWVGAEQASQALVSPPDMDQIHFAVEDLATHLALHPDLRMLTRRIALAETDVQLAEANKHSDWNVELSYAQRGPGFSNMLSLGVSAPLQWDQARRQNRELAARQSLLVQAQAERDDMFLRHMAEVSALVDAWQTDSARLRHTREQRLPLAKARVQATLASYRGGKASLAEVLQARRSELTLKLETLQLAMQTAIAWVELNFLLPESVERGT